MKIMSESEKKKLAVSLAAELLPHIRQLAGRAMLQHNGVDWNLTSNDLNHVDDGKWIVICDNVDMREPDGDHQWDEYTDEDIVTWCNSVAYGLHRSWQEKYEAINSPYERM